MPDKTLLCWSSGKKTVRGHCMSYDSGPMSRVVGLLTSPCSNHEYEQAMGAAVHNAVGEGIAWMAFGDLFLEDVRRYSERQLAGTGLAPLVPLWRHFQLIPWPRT